jgi:hypothetical protein
MSVPHQAQAQQVQAEQAVQNQIYQNNLMNQNLNMRMNPAERIGVNAVYEQIIQNFENVYGPLIAPYDNRPTIMTAIYYSLREIDILQGLGHNIQNILVTENLIRRISTAGYSSCAHEPAVPFEQLPFDLQMFFMNLSSYLVRYLIRQL